MRTALFLLFLLALGAVPGSLIPQKKISPIKVTDLTRMHPALASWYERLGLFDVYQSAWFSAIYLLLFVSLIGCVLPRIGVYAKAVRARPPKPPRRLSRLPAHEAFTAERSEAEALTAATAELRRRRFRVERYGNAVSAERGYLREAGNLLFHCSVIVSLIGVAWGALFGFRGTVLVVVGNGFSDSIQQYDDFSPGRTFNTDDLPPFSLTVDKFDARFELNGPQRGAARYFNAAITYRVTPDAPGQRYDLQVNRPLTLDGVSVYLIGHGYAPRVTVRDGKGQIVYSGPSAFLPQDGNFTSWGVVKAPDARPQQLGFEGYFLPTAVIGSQGPTSVFPDALNPRLVLTGFYGRPTAETGSPQSVYQLDSRS